MVAHRPGGMSPEDASRGSAIVAGTAGAGVGASVDDVVDDVVLVEVLVDVLVDGAALLDVAVDGLEVDVVLVVRLVLGALVDSSDEHAAMESTTRIATPHRGSCLTRE